MSDSPADDRLQEFERRWQHDRSPRVFLQFADELRRAGRTTRAIEILTEGLERHPDSVSGMVALGKTLLEADEPEHARTFLGRAVERDPSQYVANRVLVECSLRLGDVDGARERLSICRLLNDRDPELEALEVEIEALGGGENAGAAPPEGPVASPIFDLPEPEGLPQLDLPRGVAAPDDGSDATRHAVPFGALAATAEASARILAHIRAEGIFAAATGPAAESIVAPAPSVEAASADPSSITEPPVGPVPAEAAAEGEPAAAQPMFSLQSIGAEVESEGEPAAASAGAAPDEAKDAGLDELPEVEPRTAPMPTESGAAETATLGNLYLAQGHLDEAERAFRAALDRHSDDAVARRGLEEIERRRVAEAVPVPQVAGGGPTQRKIVLLSDWMNRLRADRLARRVDVS